MSLRSALQRDFSSYEIAVMGLVLSYGVAIAGTVMLALGRTGGALILLLLAPIVWLVFRQFSRCPQCAKDPMRWPGRGMFSVFLFHRLWPERECSECRYPLDDQPPLEREGE